MRSGEIEKQSEEREDQDSQGDIIRVHLPIAFSAAAIAAR
jgi:hypothetical protein